MLFLELNRGKCNYLIACENTREAALVDPLESDWSAAVLSLRALNGNSVGEIGQKILAWFDTEDYGRIGFRKWAKGAVLVIPWLAD